ncbi:MAG TPA: 50S ribosomal protein L25 [Candidatus Saccharimonadales bacterium]|nr:50S ribosomal protein L25 [Candidatus Saccharimonadales bacterium]
MADIDAPVKLEQRTLLGKGLKHMRRDGVVPAVIHNHGQESIHVMAPERELLGVYLAAGKHHPLNLEVGSDKYLALIKDAHFDPVKRRLQHVVFQAIKQNETVEAEVPIRIEGDVPAEKIGLMILHQLDAVQIEALPKNLPDELVVSAEKLAELHDKITVADLQVPSGVTILTDPEHPIATVAESRAMAAEEAAEAEAEGEGGEEGAEGQAADGTEGEASGQQAPDKE